MLSIEKQVVRHWLKLLKILTDLCLESKLIILLAHKTIPNLWKSQIYFWSF